MCVCAVCVFNSNTNITAQLLNPRSLVFKIFKVIRTCILPDVKILSLNFCDLNWDSRRFQFISPSIRSTGFLSLEFGKSSLSSRGKCAMCQLTRALAAFLQVFIASVQLSAVQLLMRSLSTKWAWPCHLWDDIQQAETRLNKNLLRLYRSPGQQCVCR